jgi:hypothetical protein
LDSSTFFQRLAILLVTSFLGAAAAGTAAVPDDFLAADDGTSAPGLHGRRACGLSVRPPPSGLNVLGGAVEVDVFRRSISELEGTRLGGESTPAAAFLRL